MNVRKLTLVETGQIERCAGNGAHTFVAVVLELPRGHVSQPPADETPCMCGAWTWAEANDTSAAMSAWLQWSQQQGVLS